MVVVDPRWTTSGPPLVIPSTLIDRPASPTTASPAPDVDDHNNHALI